MTHVIETLPADVEKDLRTLALFINLYCRYQHQEADRKEVHLPTHDVAAIARRNVVLCPECTKLLTHAFVKRTHCPMHPKPMCKHCPNHCYHPRYRQQIQEVMRFSGRKMFMSGRLDYLFHLLF